MLVHASACGGRFAASVCPKDRSAMVSWSALECEALVAMSLS